MRTFIAALLALVLFSTTLITTSHATKTAKPNTVLLVSEVPLPDNLQVLSPLLSASLQDILSALTAIPYRNDGVINDNGAYATFTSPETELSSPGLNCSGLVLQAARLLFKKNISVRAAATDRLADSGPKSPLGHDWDFGWDLLLNITEGLSRKILLPGGKTIAPEDTTGASPRGFDLHAKSTLPELLQRMRPGYTYFVSFNKEINKNGYALLHYHVGVIVPVTKDEVWLCQTTSTGKKSNKRNLASQEGRNSFLKAFKNTGNIKKYILVLETKLP